MIIDYEDSLKTWIVKNVAEFTDADADRLAMYVIALLKKPLSDNDLVELCLDKLDVFLQSHTKDFVDRLFDCLKTGVYLPEEANTGAVENLVLTDASDQEEEELSKEWNEPVEMTPCVVSIVNDQSDEKGNSFNNKEKRVSSDTLLVAQEDSTCDVKRASSSEKIVNSSTNGTQALSSAVQPASSSRLTRRRISPPNTSNSDRHGRGVGANTQRLSPVRATGANAQRISPVRGSRRAVLSSRRSPPPRGRSERYHRRRSRSHSHTRSRSRSRSPYREKRREERDDGRRHRCRDFHEKGFCMRGDKCNYDHGPDPVVIENAALEKIVNRSGASSVLPPPPVTNTSLYSPGNPPPPGIGEGYVPENPSVSVATTVSKIDFSVPPPPLPTHLGAVPTVVPVVPSVYAVPPSSSALVTVVPNVQTVPTIGSGAYGTNVSSGIPSTDVSNFAPYGNTSTFGGRSAHSFGGGRRGTRGRFKPYGGPLVNPALCSLLVKKIPPEQNKIVLLDQHFGKFGQITNLHIQYEGQPDTALVTFKTRREALNAYKSTEPIFNNRFIKVYWQTQPPEQTSENGATPVVVAGNDQSVISGGVNQLIGTETARTENHKTEIVDEVAQQHDETDLKTTDPTSIGDSDVKSSRRVNMGPKSGLYSGRAAAAAKKKLDREGVMKLVELHRLKMDLYQKQIEQQKELLQRVQTTDNKETKKKIMELVKKIEESMKTTKEDLESLSKKISVV